MNKTDCNAFVGHWPFWKMETATVRQLQAGHAAAGVEGGCVSTLDSLYYVDAMEAERGLAAQLQGSPYRHIMAANPAQPGLRRAVEEGAKKLGAAGVRIYPSYHNYRLGDACVRDLCAVLQEYKLPLYVTVRLVDQRMDHIITPQPPTMDELMAFPLQCPSLPLLYTGLFSHEAAALAGTLQNHPLLRVESSLFRGRAGSARSFYQSIPSSSLLYGSGFGLHSLQASLLLLEGEGFSSAELQNLFAHNMERFFKH